MDYRILVLLLFGAAAFLERSDALSCLCGSNPCEKPQCCSSGRYAKDACGCCDVCAKSEGETCGGPWNIKGICSDNLSCFAQCKCKTIGQKLCIFPFIYKGLKFDSCTTYDSQNKEPWCATKVDQSTGKVVHGHWQDCDIGCQDCNLFNQDGICVNQTFVNRYQQLAINKNKENPLYKFVAGIRPDESSLVVPKCFNQKHKRSIFCKCAQDGKLNDYYGDCKKPRGSFQLSGWCYLETISNPSSPKTNCYEDVEWSKSAARFWSKEACLQNNVHLPKIEGINPPAPPPWAAVATYNNNN